MSPSPDVRVFHASVSPEQDQIRLDRFWAQELELEGYSRSRIKQWIKEGSVLVNGRVCDKPGLPLKAGDSSSLEAGLETEGVVPEKGALDIAYRDAHLLVLNKPPGLSVHPAPSCPEGTLVHRLVHHFQELGRMEGERPGIVHRLDKDTTGLMLVALEEKVRLRLSRDFAARKVDKEYLALVHGIPGRGKGRIELPLARDPRNKTRMAVVRSGGREARSDYTLLWSDSVSRVSLLRVKIYTGRTHQIRVHLAELGHPIVGDQIYGAGHHAAMVRRLPLTARLADRQMLHAWRLAFVHPVSNERLGLVEPPPRDFERLALYFGRHVQRIGVTGLPGCGKSQLLDRLEKMGLPVFRADREVADLYAAGQDGWVLLRQRFGGKYAPENGDVDKQALLADMLESEGLRREVEALVHPLVRHRLERFWLENDRSKAAVAEVPLLQESGWSGRDLFDVVVGVHVGKKQRRQWLSQQRGWSEELTARMESWQWPEADKLRGCDLVVHNPGTPEGLDCTAKRLYRVLSSLRRNRILNLLDTLHAIWSADGPSRQTQSKQP